MTYVIRTSAAHMPNSCKGVYRRVAVLEVEDGVVPKMISPRAKGVRRVVRTWERLNVGSTERCAYRIALAQAEALAAELNHIN